jgi:hypothetical protein
VPPKEPSVGSSQEGPFSAYISLQATCGKSLLDHFRMQSWEILPLKVSNVMCLATGQSSGSKTNIVCGVGMHTVSVPHGPDGSVLRWPFPCRSHTTSSHWTDGGRNGLGPFRHVDVLLSRPLDGHLRTQISAANFSFALSPNSPKYDDIRFPPRLLYYLCASRPSLHHSQTDRPQHRLPCSLNSQDLPYTIHRPTILNTGFLAVSRVFFYAVHGLFCCQCWFPCSLKSQECLSTSRSV